jgi:hypothetical protein
MRKIALILFIWAFFAAPSFAQSNDAKVEEIRRIYQQTNEQLAEAEKSFAESRIYLSELIVNKGGTMYPAVGTFRSTIKFYYTFGNREENPYPNRLLKIMVLTDRSANTESSEYLFSRAGQLIFYFEKSTYETATESRFYFSNGKVISILRGQKSADIKSRQEIAASRAVQAQAEKLVGIFNRSLE